MPKYLSKENLSCVVAFPYLPAASVEAGAYTSGPVPVLESIYSGTPSPSESKNLLVGLLFAAFKASVIFCFI